MNLPKGWVKPKLGDVITYKKGKKPKVLQNEKVENMVPYIDIKAFEKGIIRQYADIESSVLVNKNDFLIVWDGARSGLTGRNMSGALGSTLMKVSALGLDNDYIFRFLQFKFDDINSNTKGIGIPHVDPAYLWNIGLPLPPLNEQKRIAQKLDILLFTVESIKTRLNNASNILKRFRQSVLTAATSGKLTEEWRRENQTKSSIEQDILNLYKKLLLNSITTTQKKNITNIYSQQEKVLNTNHLIPKSWKFVNLAKLCKPPKYGSSSKSKEEGSVPVLRMGNIQNGKLDWNSLVFTSDENEIKKYLLEKNDVLFNRTNSPELVGKTAIYKGERKAIYAGYLIKITTHELLIPDYLNYILNSPYGRDYSWKVKSDGVSQSNINAQKLGMLPVPLCSVAEQKEIVSKVESLFALADSIEAKIEAAQKRVDKLTQSILAKAFRGELVPQDPGDEPAQILLERIKAEQEAKKTKKRSKKSK